MLILNNDRGFSRVSRGLDGESGSLKQGLSTVRMELGKKFCACSLVLASILYPLLLILLVKTGFNSNTITPQCPCLFKPLTLFEYSEKGGALKKLRLL